MERAAPSASRCQLTQTPTFNPRTAFLPTTTVTTLIPHVICSFTPWSLYCSTYSSLKEKHSLLMVVPSLDRISKIPA